MHVFDQEKSVLPGTESSAVLDLHKAPAAPQKRILGRDWVVLPSFFRRGASGMPAKIQNILILGQNPTAPDELPVCLAVT